MKNIPSFPSGNRSYINNLESIFMHKKLASVVVGVALLVTPLLASAQTTDTSDASIMASLTALIQVLTQELQQLIATRTPSNGNGNTTPATLQASPAYGVSPLTVHFIETGVDSSRAAINFGDGTTCASQYTSEAGCAWSIHTYTTPGTYTVSLYPTTGTDRAGMSPYATATITVTASVPTFVGDSFDSNQNTINGKDNFTLSGSASAGSVYIVAIREPYSVNLNDWQTISNTPGYILGFAPVVNGRSSVGVYPNIPYAVGTYLLALYDGTTHTLLLSGPTLTVSATVQSPILSFGVSPATIAQGSAATLSWTAAYSGQCTITNFSTGTQLDLSHANDNPTSSYSSVSTGPLSQTTLFELRCAPLAGATGGYAVKNVTVVVNTTTSSGLISLSSPSSNSSFVIGNSIPIAWNYSNIPANSQTIFTLSLVNSTSVSGGVSGGSWQQISPISGLGSASYNWQTGPSYLEVPGIYQLSGQVRQCDPLGCQYSYPSDALLPVSATMAPVQFSINTPGASKQPTIVANVSPSTVQNSVGTTAITWHVSNAPSGAALEIGISGAALNQMGDATSPYRNILSAERLDGTTGVVDLRQQPTGGYLLTARLTLHQATIPDIFRYRGR